MAQGSLTKGVRAQVEGGTAKRLSPRVTDYLFSEHSVCHLWFDLVELKVVHDYDHHDWYGR